MYSVSIECVFAKELHSGNTYRRRANTFRLSGSFLIFEGILIKSHHIDVIKAYVSSRFISKTPEEAGCGKPHLPVKYLIRTRLKILSVSVIG